MTAIEHKELKGITIKNLIVTIISTASIVVSVMTSYFDIKNAIHDVKLQQDSQNRVYEIRLKVLEGHMDLLQQEVDKIKQTKHNH